MDLPALPPRAKDDPFMPAERAALACPRCGGWLRPHVLWFDEYYDEENYRMDSALGAAERADLLLVVGTSGATNLPMQIGRIAFLRGAALVDVNPEENPFAELAERSERGFFARGSACERLPEIVAALGAE
jgi:NAD-dependent deacetylase